MGKAERQTKILELIEQNNISTQTELTNRLIEAGYDVTQATTSRDLQELRIIKVMLSDGTYRYATAKDTGHPAERKLESMLSQCLIDIDYAVNIVVAKTMAGAAQAAAYALDSFGFEEIVGSIAGDDTIMIVARSEKQAKHLSAKLKKFIL